MDRRIRFLLNPAAGRGVGAARLGRLRALAEREGVELVSSRDAAHIAEEARRAAADGVERLIVAGGDGTVHHAAQGLAGTGCALGLLPLGTGNDLAGTLGISPDLDAAARRALDGPVRRIDLIRVDGTFCVGYAGVGFDSEVTRFANELKLLRGPLVYFYSVVHALITFEPLPMRVVYDGGTFEGRVMFTVACNLPRFGGGMRIAPDASIDDGLLDLVIVREVSKWRLLTLFPKVYDGRHVGYPEVSIARTRKVEITLDRAMTIYGGGEPVRPVAPGETVTIEVVPGALAVVG